MIVYEVPNGSAKQFRYSNRGVGFLVRSPTLLFGYLNLDRTKMEDIIRGEDGSYIVNGYEYFSMEEVKAEVENAKLLYKPEFIPFYLKEVKEYGFSNTEGLVYGFMRFYLSSNPKGQFYFTNDQLAYMLDVSPRTISDAVGKVLNCGEFKAIYKVKANGGTFRLVETCESNWKKPASLTSRNLLPNKNKINKNKINISKDIGKPSHGSNDINSCIEYLKEKVGGQLDGTQKDNRQYCYNLIRKVKKGFPELDPVEQVKIVIDIATTDAFHSRNATSFKYIYYNFVKIVKQAKESTNKVVEIK